MRSKLLAGVQAIGVGLVTVGIAAWSVPAALIVAGILAVAAGEVHGR